MKIKEYYGDCIKPAMWVGREDSELYMYQTEGCCYKCIAEVIDRDNYWMVTCQQLGLLLEAFYKDEYFGLQELQQEIEEMIAEECTYKIRDFKETLTNIVTYWRGENL